MFVSFFPRPRLFFPAVVIWSAVCIGAWYALVKPFITTIGLVHPNAPPVIGAQYFVTPLFLVFDAYWWTATILFAAFWRASAPNRWWIWSILGSSLIAFAVYIQVQASVDLNNWFLPFWDMVQAALGHTRKVPAGEYYGDLVTFLEIAFVYVTVGALNQFLVSHWIFRWRTAMNNHYTLHWSVLRTVEGAAQRVQEDTMRFSTTMETLGVTLVNSVMTLIAFTPVLIALSKHVTRLPFIGEVPNALLWAGLAWSAFGTTFLALVGVKLPGLQFKNQRVEAAYRKELVYGEDDPARAAPPVLAELFAGVRKNYFTLYFHYVYFNVARILYLQTDNIFAYVLLGPTVVAGVITFGLLNQITNAFDQVRGSMQYLVNSWSTIIELQSIYKRLRAFESVLNAEPLDRLETSPGVV
ncbi:MAG TPA: peptide antibiotic transporter SbmA [Caulobacteraceae bacterium]|nr:peptide antibiotic transporter SbmA [Caulobacteraceae bacterium]